MFSFIPQILGRKIKYRIAVVADMDKASKLVDNTWVSKLKTGWLTMDRHSQIFEIEWDKQEVTLKVMKFVPRRNRAMIQNHSNSPAGTLLATCSILSTNDGLEYRQLEGSVPSSAGWSPAD